MVTVRERVARNVHFLLFCLFPTLVMGGGSNLLNMSFSFRYLRYFLFFTSTEMKFSDATVPLNICSGHSVSRHSFLSFFNRPIECWHSIRLRQFVLHVNIGRRLDRPLAKLK